VREYLIEELAALGLQPRVHEATGVGTRYRVAGRVWNVLARVPGREAAGNGQAVVLMAHYDGVGASPAAGDDAAGSAVLLETLRALRAGPPLRNDVIALFTDGEEAGLLGAAAFVREHPWARDIGVALNFEARGTEGRSYMFETGPGNLDVVRVLRGAPHVSATSLSVTVYRSLPNDTDLSEIAVLDRPALNFAFADGVERYHTAYDDVVHLDPGSVQHHGAQALALARAFGDGPLPRPRTGDAVFFDLPFVGLVVYPEEWAVPSALAVLALIGFAVLRLRRREPRWVRDLVLGAVGAALAIALGGGTAFLAGNAIARLHIATGWGGTPAYRGIYAAGIAVLALALALWCWANVRRWASERGAHTGALLLLGIGAAAVTWKLPGVSFMVVWPLLGGVLVAHASLGAAAGASTRLSRTVTLWLATALAAAVLVPIIYAIGAVLLGIFGPGGIAVGVLVPTLAWIVAPQLETLSAGSRWTTSIELAVVALILFAIGAATVRQSVAYPAGSTLVYTLDADSGSAWLAMPAGRARPGSWGAEVLGATAGTLTADSVTADEPPEWLEQVLERRVRMAATTAPRLPIAGPTAEVISDSAVRAAGTSNGAGSAASVRRMVLRIRSDTSTLSVGIRVTGANVLAAAVDGRLIDTSRYRSASSEWGLQYAAPPDSGFTLSLDVAPGTGPVLELTARSAGLPTLPGIRIPARPEDVVPIHNGDVTVVRRVVRF
jgi:hypothetical protein